MQKFLNKIICGDCIEVLGKVRGPFAEYITGKVLEEQKNNES